MKTTLWDTPQCYPICTSGNSNRSSRDESFFKEGELIYWSSLSPQQNRSPHSYSCYSTAFVWPEIFSPGNSLNFPLIEDKQINKQKKLSSLLWKKWNLLEVLHVCIETRELRGKGHCNPIFNVDGYRRLYRVIVSRPPFYGHFMNSSRGMFSPQKFVQFPNMICSLESGLLCSF